MHKLNLFALIAVVLLGVASASAEAAVCDVDNDGDVDRDDVSLIFAARNTPASGPDDPRDADGNGVVNVLDGRQCTGQCILPNCERPPEPASLSCGDLVSGSIDAAGETDQFTFSAEAGDVVSITVSDTDGEFVTTGADARVFLFSPTGVQLGLFDADSEQVFTLPDSGTYTIEVRANNLVSTGSYNLNLECLVPPSPDAVALGCGDLVSGSIDAPAEVDVFHFSAEAGDVVSITVADTGGDFLTTGADARVFLFSPTGVQLGLFDADSEQVFTLPESGTYVIEVKANNLVSTGSYNLNLECLVLPSPDAVALGCGDLVSGSIGAPAEVDVFHFSAEAGDVVSITVSDTDGEFVTTGADARVFLFSPTGVQLGLFDADSEQVFTLPESGTYVIEVKANNLVSTGSYNLNLECLVLPSPDAVALGCGQLVSGSIDAPAEVDVFHFSAEAGDVVSITVSDTDGEFVTTGADARVFLFSPTGVQLGLFDADSEQVFTLPESGTYVIEVKANNLVSTGSYNLNLECLVLPSPDAVALSCGDLVSGSIDAPAEVDIFHFSAEAGDVVPITVADTGGEFVTTGADARVFLFSPTGVQLGLFDANSTQVFTLPESGTHVIEVKANNLVSTGSYNLGLECI